MKSEKNYSPEPGNAQYTPVKEISNLGIAKQEFILGYHFNTIK